MREGYDPNAVRQIDVANDKGEAIHEIAASAVLLERVTLWIGLNHANCIVCRLHKIQTQAGTPMLVEIDRASQFALGLFLNRDRFH